MQVKSILKHTIALCEHPRLPVQSFRDLFSVCFHAFVALCEAVCAADVTKAAAVVHRIAYPQAADHHCSKRDCLYYVLSLWHSVWMTTRGLLTLLHRWMC